ncbi:uncharacterized protein LOC141628968 [Silene latifolia]|uniref:uncharacterized protein LOC141628968 n=1 Tax=Silene latifolia TaxID=37657 RepID=UPI003D77C130
MATKVIGGRFVDDILNETTSISRFFERLNILAQEENQDEEEDQQPPPLLQLEKVCLSVYKHGEDKHEDELIENFIAKRCPKKTYLPPINTNDHHEDKDYSFKKSTNISKIVEEPESSMDDLLLYHFYDMVDDLLDEDEEEEEEDMAQEFSYFSNEKANKETLRKNISKIEEPKSSKDDHQGDKTRGFSYLSYDDIICNEETFYCLHEKYFRD